MIIATASISGNAMTRMSMIVAIVHATLNGAKPVNHEVMRGRS
ncbi:hypothetical protein [uncultured Sphingomonas sp.]